jgi:class 3 adenylate cyclase
MILEPIRETGYRFAMEAAARQGNEAEAVQIYHRLRTRLRDELGIEPGATTRDLYQHITAAAGPSLAAAPGDGVTVERTFMFTDIEASTPLLAAVGDTAWENLVMWHDRTLRGCFAAHHGEEVDHAGDGFFVAFTAGNDAIACAIAVQRALDDHRREHGFAPQVRIGLHSAAALVNEGKYLGRSVHEAARIGGLAAGGEIVASVATTAGSNVAISASRSASLKGLDEPVTVVTVEWRQHPH